MTSMHCEPFFEPGENIKGCTVGAFEGSWCSAQLYSGYQDAMKRPVSLLALDMDAEVHSIEWEFRKQTCKRALELLTGGHSEFPLLYTAEPVLRLAIPKKVFLLAIEQVHFIEHSAVREERHMATIVFQMIRSLSPIHRARLAHGSLSLNSWRMGMDGVKIVDFASLRSICEEIGRFESARFTIESDIRALGAIGLRLLSLGEGLVPPALQVVLRIATQDVGGLFGSAYDLQLAVEDVMPICTTVPEVRRDSETFSRPRLNILMNQITDEFLAH